MKVPLYSLDGKEKKEIDLPLQFEEEYREDLIKRAVLSEESKEKQPKGNYRWAGLETSAKYRGVKDTYGSLKNRGQAMLPREVQPNGRWGKVRRIPSSVKGKRAHPPKVEKKIVEKMNKKEYAKALRSALASTSKNEIVSRRWQVGNRKLPIVVENDFEKIKKTKEIVAFLEKLNLREAIEKAKERRKRRTGIRKTRAKNIIKTPKYILIVIGGEKANAACNISGVDVVRVSELKAKHLAPGTVAGRVTLFTENAIKEIGERL